MPTRKRHQNNGLRKLCTCKRASWPTCSHPYHFNYKPRIGPFAGTPFRLSIDRYVNKHVDSKTAAESVAADIRAKIDAGTFRRNAAAPATEPERLTIGELLDIYKRDYIESKRKDSVTNVTYQIGVIKKIEIADANKTPTPFGSWSVVDISSEVLERFQAEREKRGIPAANRDLSLVRAAINWAIGRKDISGVLITTISTSPFKRGVKTAVKLTEEDSRSRRLEPGEETALLAAAGPHLRAIIEAALATGMRRGEILSLQWSQVRGMTIDEHTRTVTWAPKAELFLPREKTKTKKDRLIPISSRLKLVLELRRFDPAGKALPLSGFVFGTSIGTKLLGFSRAWATARLKAHGHTPTYTETANLDPGSRAALTAINLHFHDLRREAGSRWMDRGVPLQTIRDWLGHSNISQTSTYLASNSQSSHDAMQRYDEQEAALQLIATKQKTRGSRRAGSTTTRHGKLKKVEVEHSPTIM